MALRESKGNMYSWTTHQWNPIGGFCSHDCSYCYVGKWGTKPMLHIREKEFSYDLGEQRTIFVVSGGDLFADNVPSDWIKRVLYHCHKFNNTYLFQTKNPTRMLRFYPEFPNNSIFCTTIETNRVYPQMGNTPHPKERAIAMGMLHGEKRYLTIEPIMDFDADDLLELVRISGASQVNVGADSGGHGLIEPTKSKVISFLNELNKFTIIDHKRNLNRLLQ